MPAAGFRPTPPPARTNRLDELIGSLPMPEAAAIRAWLSDGAPDGRVRPTALVESHEPVGNAVAPPDGTDPDGIRRVGIIGGGTAGYLTALALRATRPWLDVSVVESKDIPIIGVGEATVPSILPFLHYLIGLDPVDFYANVTPTWKLGIKFDWGPNPGGFMAPFDWASHSVGMLGALASEGSINGFTVESMLMAADRAPVIDIGGRLASLLKFMPFAYHLDNVRFVGYLARISAARGVHHVDATVADVVLSGEDWVECLRTTDGRELRFDFYVDCTGFRSRLLEQALGVRYESYAASLLTDSAVTANLAHGGHLKPYTTAKTMDAGWCWVIPVPENDHLGYVYSSAAISDEDAAAELARRFPGAEDFKQVRFKSGRHEQAWRGNVMGIGNSYAFVEPLESSALLMITIEIGILASSLPRTWRDPVPRDGVNAFLAKSWDALRWFLAAHYRFNTRLDTAFWRNARQTVDISGYLPLLDVFATGAPLSRRDDYTQSIAEAAAPPFYELAGVDTILLGQGVPTRLLPGAESPDRWRARHDAAELLVRRALPQREALQVVASRGDLLSELFDERGGWLAPFWKWRTPQRPAC